MVVIEMNPRVSRSSALASKATGFPIAKVAARLAVGYTLDELMNEITGRDARPRSSPRSTTWSPRSPASPSRSIPGAEPYLTTSMKCVGEVMAIGRTFAESLQKALRGLETGLTRPRRDRHRRRRRCRTTGKAALLRALAHADARSAAGDRPGLPPRPERRARSTAPAPTSPGSCARSSIWWPRRPQSRQQGLPADAGGAAAAEGAWDSPMRGWPR